MVEFAFFIKLSACLLQDKSLPMVTPRYFASVRRAISGYGWSSQIKGASFCWLYG